jgi:hypothetical protein
VCGSIIAHRQKAVHAKSQKHIKALEDAKQIEPEEEPI